MNVFAERDYRKVLTGCLREKKRIDASMNFSRMAEAIRVQRSYLSNVLGGRAQLSADQLFLASRFLGLGPVETRYLLLLLEHERTGVEDRRAELEAEILRIQAHQLESARHLRAKKVEVSAENLAAYYLDPLNAIVHFALTIERYRKQPSRLAEDLGVKSERIERAVSVLEKGGIIAPRKHGRSIELRVEHVHLPPESPLYSAFRNQLKQMSAARLQNRDDEDYSFWVTFSADKKMLKRIRAEFLALLERIEPQVRAAPSRDVYQMNFDLFGWTNGSD